MSESGPYLISFHSQKGGVGKTLLAWHLANHLAKPELLKDRAGEKPLNVALIDADLTGTSLADACPLRARGPGNRSKSRYRGVTNTRNTMKANYTGCFPEGCATPPCAFLNRFLLCDPAEYQDIAGNDAHLATNHRSTQLHHYLWQVEGLPNLTVLPSSAHPDDVNTIAPYLFREDFTDHFCHRLADLVLTLLGRNVCDGSRRKNDQRFRCVPEDGHDVVIIDCAPTLTGFSRATLKCHTELARRLETDPSAGTVKMTPVFVMSEDIQDIAALGKSLDSILKAKGDHEAHDLERALLVANRYRPKNADGSTRFAELDGKRWHMTSADDVRGYCHRQLMQYLATPHRRLERPPGQLGALFDYMVAIPYDEALSTTFTGDGSGTPPEWKHPEAMVELIARCGVTG